MKFKQLLSNLKNKLSLFIVVSCISMSAYAASMVAALPTGAIVTLFDTPCTNTKVLDAIVKEYHPMFQTGKVLWQGKDIVLCWTIDQGNVVVIDETGAMGEIPILFFAPKESI